MERMTLAIRAVQGRSSPMPSRRIIYTDWRLGEREQGVNVKTGGEKRQTPLFACARVQQQRQANHAGLASIDPHMLLTLDHRSEAPCAHSESNGAVLSEGVCGEAGRDSVCLLQRDARR